MLDSSHSETVMRGGRGTSLSRYPDPAFMELSWIAAMMVS